MTTLYGITNCDSVKKARRWLDNQGIEYNFHNFRKDGLDESRVRKWCDEVGHETLLNKRGTTWRKLPDDIKENIDTATAIDLMVENPSVIKRPVVETNDRILVGFAEDTWQQVFS